MISIILKTGSPTHQHQIPINTDDLKYWDVEKYIWVLEPGKINIMVGAASYDISLRGILEAKTD